MRGYGHNLVARAKVPDREDAVTTTGQTDSRPAFGSARLRRPRLAAGLVDRARVAHSALAAGPVCLVCAPAGYGKTTLVASWAEELELGGDSVAWFTVEDQDNQPFQFWSALLEALSATPAARQSGRFDELRPPQPGFEQHFLELLDEAVTATPSLRWLVLDDVQKLDDPQITAGLERLLATLSPGFGVVLVCRFDPALNLHRLRLSGDLREIRAADLAFTDQEAESLLELANVSVGPEDVRRLVRRTEGWAVGLRLAAVSLVSASDTSAFVSSFDGDGRAVADYLFTEILRHLPDDLRDFLIDTCVPDQLCASLAHELSGVVNAGELLDRLSRANALVVQSGDPSWFRYHSLLRGYLSAAATRRDAGALRRQHAIAARWFDEHGQPAVALHHAAQAGDDDQLLKVIGSQGLPLLLSGRAGLVRDMIATASDAVRQDPAAAVIAALASLDLGDPLAADGHLAALGSAGPLPDERLVAMHDSAVVQRALLGGDVAKAMAETGLDDRRVTGDRDVDLVVLSYRGPARVRAGDNLGAIDDLSRALSLAREAKYDQFVLWALSQLSGAAGAMCDFVAMKHWSQEAIEFAEPRGWIRSPRLAYAYLLAAWTGFQTGDLHAQAMNVDLAMGCLQAVVHVEVEVGVRSMDAVNRFELASGSERHAAAATYRQIWTGPLAEQVSAALIGSAAPHEVRLALAVGEMTWAADAVERVERWLPETAESLTLRAQLLAARDRPTEALRTLAPVLRGDVPVHVDTTMVAANLLAAVLRTDAGDPALAHEALVEAVTWSAPRDFKRPFIDSWGDVMPLLAHNSGRFGHADSFVESLFQRANEIRGTGSDQHPASLTLTARELELLRDLPSQMTTSEIATARTISINTAKTHLSAVYRKLGVDNRNAAVREARRLGMI